MVASGKDYLAAGVAVAGADSVVVVVVVVVVVSVPVVAVLVDAAVPVSSTTAGASAAGAASGAAASFFWQPVASAMAVAAAKPKVRNFFISLISFFLMKRFRSESASEARLQNRRGMISEARGLSSGKDRPRRRRDSRLFLARPRSPGGDCKGPDGG